MSEDHHSDELYVRQRKLDELREKGVQPYGEKYEVTHRAMDIIDEVE